MTECNTSVLQFSHQSRRRVEADFTGGTLTSDAGLLLLRQVDAQLQLTQAVSNCLCDPRNPASVTHQLSTMVAQRVLGIAAGYEDLNDHQTMRCDPALQLAANVEPLSDKPLASPPTLCRLEKLADRQALVQMQAVLVDQFIADLEAQGGPAEPLILDFDATDDPLHGQQEQRFFNAHYKSHCYLPLYVFCGQHLLCAYLRPANRGAATHAWAILKLLTQRIRQRFPQARIIFRGDSGFCRWKMMRWCDRNNVGYIVGLQRNTKLHRLAQPWLIPARLHATRTQQKVRLFGSFSYAAGSWDRKRRVIVKAECMPDHQDDNPRYVVTNLAGDEHELYDVHYCQRGDMENRIKEQQLDLFADRTSCSKMLSNQLRLLFSSFAYVLMMKLRQTADAGSTLSKMQCSTIRNKLIKVAARVRVSARRIYFQLPTSYPHQALWRQIVQRLVPS